MPGAYVIATAQGDYDPVVLDPVGVKAVARAVRAWRIAAPDAARLLGVSERTWSGMKAEAWTGALTEDQRWRVSALVGIYKGLHLYFGDELADKWVKMPNRGPLFESRTPLRFMLDGGLPALLA